MIQEVWGKASKLVLSVTIRDGVYSRLGLHKFIQFHGCLLGEGPHDVSFGHIGDKDNCGIPPRGVKCGIKVN